MTVVDQEFWPPGFSASLRRCLSQTPLDYSVRECACACVLSTWAGVVCTLGISIGLAIACLHLDSFFSPPSSILIFLSSLCIFIIFPPPSSVPQTFISCWQLPERASSSLAQRSLKYLCIPLVDIKLVGTHRSPFFLWPHQRRRGPLATFEPASTSLTRSSYLLANRLRQGHWSISYNGFCVG